MKRFTADFETSYEKDENEDINCWVWSYALCEIGNTKNFIQGNNIDDFMEFCYKNANLEVAFHNLKYDGEYILYWLLKNGYEEIFDSKKRKSKTFQTLISGLGQFYSIEVYFEVEGKKTKKVKFTDSLKLLNMSVDNVAKAFSLPIQKLDMDYDILRRPGYIPTEEELAYIKNDVVIMAMALEELERENLTSLTIGSCALNNYKKMMSDEKFKRLFPVINDLVFLSIKMSYKGGFTYLNPIYKDKLIENEIILDINSMYPNILRNKPLPYGIGIYFEGKYVEDKLFNLYIQQLSCSFKLKPNKIPCIQIKDNVDFKPTEYLESSNNDLVTLCLTNIDIELFFENYEVKDVTYHGGFKFKSSNTMFTDYVDYWYGIKKKATIEKNAPMRSIAKVMLNSLYGKFGSNIQHTQKHVYLDDDVVKYDIMKSENSDGIYIPVASFVTSYGRNQIIRDSQKIRDYSLEKYGKDCYIYNDTDSIHTTLNDDDIKKILPIDNEELGYYKIEDYVKRAKYLRAKCYIQEFVDGSFKTTIAGLPKKLGVNVNFDNFNENLTVDGKLIFKHVKGGVILVPTTFSIK